MRRSPGRLLGSAAAVSLVLSMACFGQTNKTAVSRNGAGVTAAIPAKKLPGPAVLPKATPPAPRKKLSPEEANRQMPSSEIFEKDGARYMRYGTGESFILHPTLKRAWGAGYGTVTDGAGRKLNLNRPPYVMFMLFEESPYDWYKGMPLRRDYASLSGSRHPLNPYRPKPGSKPPLFPKVDADFERFIEQIVPSTRMLSAFETAGQYASLYDWYVIEGQVADPKARDCAYKAIKILVKLAQAFPQWHAQKDRSGIPGEDQSRGGLWVWPGRRNQFKLDIWGPLPAAQAYDKVYHAEAEWKRVSEELKVPAKKTVEVSLLQEAVWNFHQMGLQFGHYNNRDKYVAEGLCNWAVCLDDPVLYHFALRMLDDQSHTAFMADGTYYEQAYLAFLLRGLLDEYQGLPPYYDPPGWRDPFDGSCLRPPERKPEEGQGVFRIGAAVNAPEGWSFALYPNAKTFAEVREGQPATNGILRELRADLQPGRLGFGVRYTGFLHVTKTDTYQFLTRADDLCVLSIDGQRVTGSPEPGAAGTGSAFLTQGAHPVELDFLDFGGGRSVLVALNQTPFMPEPVRLARQHVLRVADYERKMMLPDGRIYPLNEASSEKRPMEEFFGISDCALFNHPRVLAESRSELLTWPGHSSLGRGKGEDQVQVRLEYSDHMAPHAHDDAFSLGLFANGQEILADNSYVHKDGWCRDLSRSAYDHNTVAVEGKDAAAVDPWTPFSGPKPRGNLYFSGETLIPGMKLLVNKAEGQGRISQVLWQPDEPVQVTEVVKNGERRSIMVVPAAGQQVYVVDVFRVSGGTNHVWSAHGPSQHDYRITFDNLTLGPPGPVAKGKEHPEGSSVRSTGSDETFSFRIITPDYGFFQTAQTKNAKGNSAQRLRRGSLKTTLLGSPGTRVRLALTANARAYDQIGLGERSARKDHVYVSREGHDNVFVAVHEPYEEGRSAPLIRKVSLLPSSAVSPGVVALRIELPGRTDTVIFSGGADGTARTADVDFKGRCGFAAVDASGRADVLHLIEGDTLKAGGQSLSATRTVCGTISAIQRRDAGDRLNAFVASGAVPGGAALKGRWLMLELGDGETKWFPIADIAEQGGNTAFVVDGEPGFAFQSGYDPGLKAFASYVQYLYFPQLGVLGGLSFKVPDCATYVKGK